MAVYSLAFVAIGAGGNLVAQSAGTAGPLFELYTTSADRPRVMEVTISIFGPTTQSDNWAIGRPAATGTPVSAYLARPIPDDDQSPPSNVYVGFAWTVRPTAPINFFRRFPCIFSAAIGGGRTWKFPQGLTVAPNASIVFWSAGTGGAQQDAVPMNVNVVIDE